MLLTAVLLATLSAAPPKPFVEGPAVEGVRELSLPNGFRVLLLPDPSAATLNVNLTVLVGSRHEGYGEKGMAHLLEHLLFKGSKRYPDPKKELSARGGRWNGTTSEDRTNYFESMPASDANTDFAIRFEADRLVNCFVDKKDLDTEMTVVRNEFERAESSPGFALFSRVRAAAFPWHNYGRSVIGIKADIELVPIDNLKGFYKTYYQPDNAVLLLSGRFDEAKALRTIAQTFGKLPRPRRKLPDTFTNEPPQDGERQVTVRRVGGAPSLLAAWRIPSVSDPDYPALMVLQGVLGDEPQGLLHQKLVDGRKAAKARCDLDELKEPGLFTCYAGFKEGDATGPAREALLGLLEKPTTLTDAGVARSRDGWLAQRTQELERTEALTALLSEWVARGDWRLLFLLRDRLAQVTRADVERVWAAYFKPQNRTLGEYVPTPKPDRVELPPPADPKAVLQGYTGRAAIAQGEAFDPSPKNIEARTTRVTLPNGAKLVLLPKKTRGEAVRLALTLKLGTGDSLKGQQAATELTAQLLERGTKKLDYRAFRSALERLKTFITVSGSGQQVQVTVMTRRESLGEVLDLLHDMLRAPALDAKELEVLRTDSLSRLDQVRGMPSAVGSIELQRLLTPLPKGHPDEVLSLDEQAAALKKVTLADVQRIYQRFYGGQAATVAVVGDFEAGEVQQKLTQTLGTWTAPEKYQRAADPFVAVPGQDTTVATPDKPNAWVGAGLTVDLTDDAPDYPALLLASGVLGGGTSGRLFVTLREKQGLSYGAYARLRADAESRRGTMRADVTFAPENLEKVESGLSQLLQQWPTISKAELDAYRAELLQSEFQGRADDDELVHLLVELAADGRTLDFVERTEAALKAATPESVNAAVKKHFDASRVVRVKAGDFRKTKVTAPK